MEFGLVDLLRNFRQRLLFRHLNTWFQVCQDIFLSARCDYILGLDRRLFKTVGIHYLQKLFSDHFDLWAHLHQRPKQCHESYLQVCLTFSLTFPAPKKLIPEDEKLQKLKALDPPPPPFPRLPIPQRISKESLCLIDKRTSVFRNT